MLRTVAVLAVSGTLISTTACGPIGSDGDGDGPAPGGTIRPGGELRVALAEEPDLLDPTLARTLVGRIVFVSICEKLYDVDAELNLVPQLAAELPEISEDGLTMTIPVREGVTFADGTPLDAEAVKVSLDRHQELEGSARAAELTSVDSVEVVDEMTVAISLNAPFAPLTAVLADRSGMIMSPTALAEKGEDFGTDPVCVGPFRFSDRVAQDRIEVVKDPNYYDAENVYLDQVTYRIIADATTRFNNLRSGDVEVLERTAPTDVAALESDPDLQLISSESLGYQGITINIGNADGITQPPGPLPDEFASPLSESPLVRQALELSLDREAINQAVFLGQFAPACGPISPASPLSSDAAQTCAEHDPAAAQDLLAQAGVEVPVRIELMIGTDAQARRLGEAIQAQAAEGGFEIELNDRVLGRAGPGRPGPVPELPDRLVRPGRPGRQHRQLPHHPGPAEHRRLPQPGGGPADRGRPGQLRPGGAARPLRPAACGGPGGQPDHLPLPAEEPDRRGGHGRRGGGVRRRAGPAGPRRVRRDRVGAAGWAGTCCAGWSSRR
jgi:peptide/nickel transport system substrate-binding protein